MPWPAGGPNVCVLVEETRWPIEAATVDRLIVAPRPRDLRAPGRAPRRDLAGAGPRRPGRLHRPEPLRPLGAPRRHALRLRPPLQPRPARGAARAAPLRPRAPRRARSTRRRRTAGSGCRPPTSGSASAAASTRAWSPARCSSRRPKQVYARPPSSGSKVAVPGPLDVLEGLAGPKPEPVARPRPRRRSARPAPVSRRLQPPARAHSSRGISVLPRSRTLCYHRADFAGDARANPRQNHSLSARGGPGSEQRKGVGVQLSFIDLGGSRSLRDGALRDRQGRQAARRGRARPRARSRRCTPNSADFREHARLAGLRREEQGKAIAAIAAAMGLGPTVTNTLGLMAQNRRLFVVPGLIAQVKALIAAERGEVTAEVTSAKPLTKAPDRGARRRRSRRASART